MLKGSGEASEEDYFNVEDFDNRFNELREHEKSRYKELAVFPEDIVIPMITLKRLWTKIRKQSDPDIDANTLCEHLQELSLLSYDADKGFVYLDKLKRQRLILKVNNPRQGDHPQPGLQFVHQQLLYAHQPSTRKWADLPDDEPYFWDHLVFHLIEAARIEDLIATLTDWQYLVRKIRLRGVPSIESDLLTAKKVASSNSKLRTVDIAFGNHKELFGDWVEGGGSIVDRFAKLQFLEELNKLLEGQSRSSGTQFLSLKFEIPSIEPVETKDCCFSHDGILIATASAEREDSLKIWEAQSGIFLHTLGRLEIYDDKSKKRLVKVDGHTEEVKSCNFGYVSSLIASGSEDRTLKIWDVETRKIQRTLRDDSGRVNDCCFSPNGRLIASASSGGTLKIWEVSENTAPRWLKDGSYPINKCVFGKSGDWIISASSDGALRVWDIKDIKRDAPLHKLCGHSVSINSCCFSDKSRKIVSASDDGTLNIWDVDSLEDPPLLLGEHSAAVNDCCFSVDGKLVVSASTDKTIKVWDVATRQCQATFTADGELYCCAMHGDMIVAGGARGVYFLKLMP